jgi:coproporphyrinogen dehydrogenase
VKTVKEYEEVLATDKIPVYRGHILSEEDLILRRHILNLMCQFHTSWEAPQLQFPEAEEVKSRLAEMEKDGLIRISPHAIEVTDAGKPFVRNICMAFDLRLQRNVPTTRIFSMTI